MGDDSSSFSAVVSQGDRRSALEALRDLLAGQLEDEADGRVVAALSRQLTDVLQQIDGLPNGRNESQVDDLSSRRQARRSQASGQ